jgi:hypothetical protein
MQLIRFKDETIKFQGSDLKVTVIPGFDSTSNDYYINGSVSVDAWDSVAPGVGVPNNWIHKGQESYNTDRTLLDILNSEFVNQQGMVGEYFVTSYDKEYDKLYGEDNDRKYLRKFDFMFFTDEMFEPDYSNNMWGIWADNTNQIDVAKLGFLASSKTGSLNSELTGLEQGFTQDENFVFDEYQPQIGDYVYVKSVGLYYEISNVKNRYTSLQGTSFWQLTLLPMKDHQDKIVSNENNMEDQMQNINDASNQMDEEDKELFNMNEYPKEEGNDVEYNQQSIDEEPELTDSTGSDGWF